MDKVGLGEQVCAVKGIPESEQWLHEPALRQQIDRSLAWALNNPPQESDPAALKVTNP